MTILHDLRATGCKTPTEIRAALWRLELALHNQRVGETRERMRESYYAAVGILREYREHQEKMRRRLASLGLRFQ